MRARTVLIENLRVLATEIEAYAASREICRERRTHPHPAVLSLASSMPLGHSLGSGSLQSIARKGHILSRDELERQGIEVPGGDTERILGTAGDVFTYVGPFRYQTTSCGFFFRQETEQAFSDTAIGTPFDSGATLKYLRPSESVESQIAFVRRHEMPVPELREYFQRHLTLLFVSPWDYVDGTGPDLSGPIRTEGGDARRWTFEVRFETKLPLDGNLLAVIIPSALGIARLETLEQWMNAGVEVKTYETPDPEVATEWQSLYRESVQYLKEWNYV